MKKFMKAIAFATVMCMLLSTAAFAAPTSGTSAIEDSTIDVTITGLNAADEQVAIVVTTTAATAPSEIATGNILFVGQKAASANAASFEDINVGNNEKVNVFLGCASNTGDTAIQLAAEKVAVAEADTIEIVKSTIYTTTQIKDMAEEKGLKLTDVDAGVGAVLKLKLVLAEGRAVKDVIWSLTYDNGKKAYAKASDEVIAAFQALEGDIQPEIGIAVSSGTNDAPIELDENGVNVIVLTGADGADDQELFTDVTDNSDEYRGTMN